MHNPFETVQVVYAKRFTSLPAGFRRGVGAWRFDSRFLPTHFISGPEHGMITNTAFGGADGKTLYMTESLSNEIWHAEMPSGGVRMFGLST